MLGKNLLINFHKINFLKFQNYINNYINRNITTQLNKKMSYKGRSLQEILTSLENFAPLKYAENWDNVGLLIEAHDNKSVIIDTILLTNDLTENVLNEAISYKTGLIITYHPNIFQGLKSVSTRTWKERIVLNCIKNNISVFSPHTSWDAVQGGVNDWLAQAFPIEISKPIKQSIDNPEFGAGRLLKLQNTITIKDALENIKRHIGIPHLRLALAKDKNELETISTVALCAGSGASVLNGVEADLYLTGEMLHHDILDATQKGIHVILCNHSDSERGFLKQFQDILQNNLLNNDVKIIISQRDKDPLKTV